MDIRPYFGLPEDPNELPLVTDHATVTDVEPLDESRNDEVRPAVARYLEQCGRPDLFSRSDDDIDVDWDGVRRLVEHPPDEERDSIDALRALADRFERPYPSLLRIRLRLDEPLEFLPGQFVGINFQDIPRAYSITSTPGDRELELCVRRVPGGKLTWELFTDLEPGDQVVVRGPYGDFVLAEPSGRDVVFLATGTGVAPLKSMIDFVFGAGHDAYEGTKRHVWLFLGAAWEDDLPYRDHFGRLDDERENFHFVPTLSRERYLTDWTGETAYVQDALVAYLEETALPDGIASDRTGEPKYDVDARLDPAAMDVYACGVTAMVSDVAETLLDLSVPEERIRAEGFG